MGTKHTSRGPNRRRRKVSAVRTFPPGCSPPVPDPSEPFDSASGPEVAPPEAGASPEIPPASDGTEAAGAGDRSPPESHDIDRQKNPAPAVRNFPLGCRADARELRKEEFLPSAAASKAKNLGGESIDKVDGEVKLHDPNNTQIRAQETTVKSSAANGRESSKRELLQSAAASKATNLVGDSIEKAKSKRKSHNFSTQEAIVKPATTIGETSGKNDAFGSIYDKILDMDRKKRSLLEQPTQSGRKVDDSKKRKLSEDPEQGVIDTMKQTHGDAPGKIVVVLGLMAAQNCPWRNGRRSRVSKPQPGPRIPAK